MKVLLNKILPLFKIEEHNDSKIQTKQSAPAFWNRDKQ